MHSFFINLAEASDRRDFLKQNFADSATRGWTLTRVEAITDTEAQALGVPGRRSAREKACFLSHRTALQRGAGVPDHVMILEDDVLFSRHSCLQLDDFMAHHQHSMHWDIILTDICVSDTHFMRNLVRLRRDLVANNRIVALDLHKLDFAGATAYIVHRDSREKLVSLLRSYPAINLPYDLFLRSLVHRGEIRAFVLFPFLTTLSPHADRSSVQDPDGIGADLVWNTFRRMVWIGGSYREQLPVLNAISETVGEEARAYSTLWAAMADEKFRDK